MRVSSRLYFLSLLTVRVTLGGGRGADPVATGPATEKRCPPLKVPAGFSLRCRDRGIG